MKIKVNTDKIRLWRKERGWSQEQVAEMAGVSLRTIQRIESGKAASRESAVSLANVYSVDPTVLMVDVDGQIEKGVEKELAKNLMGLKLSFNIHAICFVMGIVILLLINFATSPQYFWVRPIIIFWLIGLFAHGATIYLVDYIVKKKKEIEALDSINP